MSQVEPRIHVLPVITPFPVAPTNVYLLEGEPLTMVDTGPLTDEALEVLTKGVRDLGYSLADIRQLIITHAHIDHFGLAREVVKQSGATVLSFRQNKQPLEDFHIWWEERMTYATELFLEEGIPQEAVDKIAPMRDFQLYANPVPEVTPLDDNDELQLGDTTWRAIHTPGHALGHLCFYNEASQLLISGDHLLRDITSNPIIETPRWGMTTRPRSLVDYMHSLRRIRELEVRQVLPGHGDPVYGHRALVDEILTHHEQRGQAVLQLLRGGQKTVYELGLALFGSELQGVHFFLVMSEIIGHLDVLELGGKVRRLERKGHYIWAAIHLG
jgi:glyoxylase-like metal-dependent hydrolase (beta-lactamase superfamily II)